LTETRGEFFIFQPTVSAQFSGLF